MSIYAVHHFLKLLRELLDQPLAFTWKSTKFVDARHNAEAGSWLRRVSVSETKCNEVGRRSRLQGHGSEFPLRAWPWDLLRVLRAVRSVTLYPCTLTKSMTSLTRNSGKMLMQAEYPSCLFMLSTTSSSSSENFLINYWHSPGRAHSLLMPDIMQKQANGCGKFRCPKPSVTGNIWAG